MRSAEWSTRSPAWWLLIARCADWTHLIRHWPSHTRYKTQKPWFNGTKISLSRSGSVMLCWGWEISAFKLTALFSSPPAVFSSEWTCCLLCFAAWLSGRMVDLSQCQSFFVLLSSFLSLLTLWLWPFLTDQNYVINETTGYSEGGFKCGVYHWVSDWLLFVWFLWKTVTYFAVNVKDCECFWLWWLFLHMRGFGGKVWQITPYLYF